MFAMRTKLKTGQRRDAFYSGVFVSCDKMAIAVATIFQGILLVWSGFDATLPMQRPETVKLWILMLVITQPLGFLLGFVGVLFYPLTASAAARFAPGSTHPNSGGDS